MARIFTMGLSCFRMPARTAPSRLGMLTSVTTTLISPILAAKRATASEPSLAMSTLYPWRDGIQMAALCGQLGRRQVHPERGAPPDLGLQADEAAVVLHDAAHGGKAEPRALAGLLGRVEGLPNVRKGLWRDSRARVLDVQDEPGARHGAVDLLCGALIKHAVLRPEAQHAANGHRVAGVDAEVQENLVNLRRVGHDGPQVGREILV